MKNPNVTKRAVLLDDRWPLPLDRPFTTQDAVRAGVSVSTLSRLTSEGFLRRVLKGVYVASQVIDGLPLRALALALVVPPTAVVTDRTAAWLHGADVLAPGDHLLVPAVSVFQLPGNTRVRRSGCKGGERTLAPDDVMVVDGVRVTTPLRTALDLGRLLSRDHAIGALDGLLRLKVFDKYELLAQIERFKRQRGVVQLRELAPLADARAESPAESVMRLRWLDTNNLPPPTPQVPVFDDWGNEAARVDLGIPEIRFGAEYDGEEWHSSDEQREHDRKRRKWLRDERHWTIEVLGKTNVFGADQNASVIFRDGIARARKNLGTFRPRR